VATRFTEPHHEKVSLENWVATKRIKCRRAKGHQWLK